MAERGWRSRPEIGVAAALGLLQAVVTVVVLRQTSLNADDVWVQSLWAEWRPFASVVTLPRDAYAIHALVALPIEAIIGPSLGSIALTSIVLNVAALAMLLRFASFLARRVDPAGRDHLFPIAVVGAWFVLVGNEFTAFAVRPNHRNIELGLMLLVIQELTEQVERRRFDRRTVLAVIGAGVVYFNDPMIVVAAGLPWCAYLLVQWFRSTGDDSRLGLLGTVAGGVAMWIVLTKALEAAGLRISDYAPPVFVRASEIPVAAVRTADLTLRMFGADVAGRDLRSLATLTHLSRLVVVAAVLVGIWHVRRKIPDRARLPIMGLVAGAVGVAAAMTLSTIGAIGETQNPRYTAPIVVVIIVMSLLPLLLGDRRVRWCTAALIIGFGCLTLISTIRVATASSEPWEEFRERSVSLDRELQMRDVDAVFGSFWIAIPLEYWSTGDAEVTAIRCDSSQPAIDPFARRDVLDDMPDRVVVAVSAEAIPGQCDRTSIADHFGTVIREEAITTDDGHQFTLLTFDSEPVGALLG